MPQQHSRATHDELIKRLGHIHEHLVNQDELIHHLERRIKRVMTTVAEVNAKLDEALAKLTANTDAFAGISQFIADVRIELAAVKQQLQDLIDAGNNPPELTEVAAKVDALIAATDAQALKEAAITGTPDDPTD